MKKLILIALGARLFNQPDNVQSGTVQVGWDNPPQAVLVEDGTTGYLVKHASAPTAALLTSAILTNFFLMPVNPYNPPSTVVFTNLPPGWHAFTLESSNALQTPPEISNVATGYCNWLLRGPVNVFVQSVSVSNITLTLQTLQP